MKATLTADAEFEDDLNRLLLSGDIVGGFEIYAAAFERFYHDAVEITNDGKITTGKERAREKLLEFLVPLHVAFEVTGEPQFHKLRLLKTAAANENCVSWWQFEIVALDGRENQWNWKTARQWQNGRIIREEHTAIEVKE